MRGQFDSIGQYRSKIKVSEIVGNIQTFHKEAANNNSVIQVASQFNLLEMISPFCTPEDGVDIYETDLTQGPACAVACGAGNNLQKLFCKCRWADWANLY